MHTILILDLVWLNTIWDKSFLLFLFIKLFPLDDLPSLIIMNFLQLHFDQFKWYRAVFWSNMVPSLIRVTKIDYIVSFCLFGLPFDFQCFWLLYEPKSTIFEGFEETWNIFWNKLHLLHNVKLLLRQIQAASKGLQFVAIQSQRSNFLDFCPFGMVNKSQGSSAKWANLLILGRWKIHSVLNSTLWHICSYIFHTHVQWIFGNVTFPPL